MLCGINWVGLFWIKRSAELSLNVDCAHT
jgi:hypothetical protein